MDRLVRDLRTEAIRLGFRELGIASAAPSAHGTFFREWIDRGFHGEMGYLARPDAFGRRENLSGTMETAQSVVVVAQNHFQEDSPGIPGDISRGVVARYARGQDYHDVMKSRLQELLGWIRQQGRGRGLAEDVQGFAYVDTGPILERELGMRGGLGWFGKNTMLIQPRQGSYFFLGLLLLDLPLPVDPSFDADHCGSCRACLDACPTGALLGRDESGAPVMDARRCISYLTIELKGPVPIELRPAIGNRIFGCDICQEVCPWNQKFAIPSLEPAYEARPGMDGQTLVELMGLSDGEFFTLFSGSPVKRAKRRGLLRNVAVALGNWLGSVDEAPKEAVAALVSALSDPEALVRGHAAWALGRIRSKEARPVLVEHLAGEEDAFVREEIELALASSNPASLGS
ncbi:MAG: tRNA epoxyqueuosine(34) reductase QueG [Gemmatimonadota bacterium]